MRRRAFGRADIGSVLRSAGLICSLTAVTAQCGPDETSSPLDPAEASLESTSREEWWQWRETLQIVPDSLAIVAGETRRASAVISSVVGDTVTISLNLIDEDSAVMPIEPTEWSIDFDPTHLSISDDLLVTALEPTPPDSPTSVVVKHVDTELAAEVDVSVLPADVGEANDPDSASNPGGWPNNEPAGMTPIIAVDGSSKNWPGFSQHHEWLDDNRVTVVNDANSKHGRAIEKRFFIGDEGGWHGLTSANDFGAWDELYIRIVYRLSPNWQWHKGGGKYLYYGAAGRLPFVGPTQFVLGWEADGTPRWSAHPVERYVAEGVAAPLRDVYHTLEIHHVASTSGANGSMRMWVDGVEVQSFTRKKGLSVESGVKAVNREWNTTRLLADKRLSGMQAFLFWGGQNDTKRVNDWVRLSELYISGRN